MQETQFWSLGREDPLEKEMATCSSFLASEIPWTEKPGDFWSPVNSWSLLKLMSIESVMPFNHLILYCPLLLSPSIFPSIRIFSNELVLCIRWPNYWSFSFNISPSNEHSGLISLRMDWFYLLVLLLLLSRFSRVWLCETPKTAAHQVPPSLGFSRQEHWSGLPFPSPMHESEKWKWSRSVVSDS